MISVTFRQHTVLATVLITQRVRVSQYECKKATCLRSISNYIPPELKTYLAINLSLKKVQKKAHQITVVSNSTKWHPDNNRNPAELFMTPPPPKKKEKKKNKKNKKEKKSR